MPVIGFLRPGSPEPNAHLVAAFRKGLSEAGYVEGRNVAIEYRWARDNDDRLPELAADLVRLRVAVIATPGSTAAAPAAKSATTTIPIVFSAGGDPVQTGLVASLNRPGGNVTGVSSMSGELGAKRLGLLQELVPRAARFAVLVNPNNPLAEAFVSRRAGGSAGHWAANRSPHRQYKSRHRHGLCDAGAKSGPTHSWSDSDPLFVSRRVQLATLAARQRCPRSILSRDDAEAGGLMSYGPSNTDLVSPSRRLYRPHPQGREARRPAGPAATKFELVINLKTAKALGLDVPPTLLARADEVIE